jgi:hypothetical protein
MSRCSVVPAGTHYKPRASGGSCWRLPASPERCHCIQTSWGVVADAISAATAARSPTCWQAALGRHIACAACTLVPFASDFERRCHECVAGSAAALVATSRHAGGMSSSCRMKHIRRTRPSTQCVHDKHACGWPSSARPAGVAWRALALPHGCRTLAVKRWHVGGTYWSVQRCRPSRTASQLGVLRGNVVVVRSRGQQWWRGPQSRCVNLVLHCLMQWHEQLAPRSRSRIRFWHA